MLESAERVIARCRTLAGCKEEPGHITRTFLSPPMREVHTLVTGWMQEAGLAVTVDDVGNIRGRKGDGKRMILASHLDSVRRAGAFDGILGVMLGIGLAALRDGPVEVIGFSEEEGVRFGTPFLGSRALAGTFEDALLKLKDADGVTVAQSIRDFGLDPSRIGEAQLDDSASGYLEFHIEQGPVLERLDLPLGVVEAISGQTRMELTFTGAANHAGTTPMHLRRDALAAAAEWILAVERAASNGLVATVGRINAKPGAGNVIPGEVLTSLDVRHSDDAARAQGVKDILASAKEIAGRRGIKLSQKKLMDQAAVSMNASVKNELAKAVEKCGFPVHRLPSGAGHDAMILAPHLPTGMLFLRSPGGISHHPDESVSVKDVAAALKVGVEFLKRREKAHA